MSAYDTIDKQPEPKTYLGDGAYARVDEFGDMVLTTENGISVQNRVVLEPMVVQLLERFIAQTRRSPDTDGDSK